MFTSEISTIVTFTPDNPAGVAQEESHPTRMLAAFIESIRRYKEDRTRMTPTDHDLAPIIRIEREGRMLGAFEAPQVNKEFALAAARAAFGGFGANTVMLVMDAHMSPVTPDEAANYQPGEMQRRCDEEGSCALGLMTDLLIFHRVTRRMVMQEPSDSSDSSDSAAVPTIEVEIAIVPYIFHESGESPPARLQWASSIREGLLEEKSARMREAGKETEGIRIGGYITDNLLAAAILPSAFDVIRAMRGCPPEDRKNQSGADDELRLEIDNMTRAALVRLGFKAFDHTAQGERSRSGLIAQQADNTDTRDGA